MKTIFVDDEMWSLSQFQEECAGIPEIEVVGEFTLAKEALDYARTHPVEFALLDIELPGMNGVELAKELRKLYPDIIVVFVTGHKEYLQDFIDMKADYYVMKPYSREDVEDVIKRAKLLAGRFKKKVFIRTFGTFEVFVDGKPLYFRHAKAKELLALITDRAGSPVSSGDALAAIWEKKTYDKNTASAYRMAMSRLRETLEEAGILDILAEKNPREKYLDTSRVDCDLVSFLNEDGNAVRAFTGLYMSNYSWAEERLAGLIQMKDEILKRKG